MKEFSDRQLLKTAPLWKLILVCISFGVLALCHAAEPAAQQPGSSGWAVHYYGGPTFWCYAGTVALPGSELTLNMSKVSWPKENRDTSKGPLFVRSGGAWSLAAYAKLHVEKEGEYRFAIEPAPDSHVSCILQVNGRMLDEVALQKPLKLPAGEVPLSIFVRPADNKPTSPKLKILWQIPGTDKLSPLPADALTHDSDDMKRVQVCSPDFPLNLEQGEEFRYAQRRFTVDLPESGLYEFAAHVGEMPRFFKVWLDGIPLLYFQGESHGIKYPLYQATDRIGATDSQRFDFLYRARAVRPLLGGKHIIDIHATYSYACNDEMKEAMQRLRIGLSKVDKTDPDRSLSIYPKGRSDMVFKRGEPLTVCVAQATVEPTSYTMEIVEERGDGKVIWQKSLKLSGGKSQASDEFEYPCDKEGAFEYVVRDEAGRAVDGPWAFVVVDPTPLERPRNAGGKDISGYRRELVDSVDCTLPSDKEHVFRDNGTSQVVGSDIGKYRVTGTSPMRSFGYVKDGDSWRRVKEGEKAEVKYEGADWFAYTLKVRNPGRPHLVVGQVPNDIKRLVSMYATDQVTGHYNGWNLDAGDAPESGPFSPLSFVVWPNCKAMDVMVYCSNLNRGFANNRQGAMAKIELYELPDGLPALPEAAGGWNRKNEFGWNGEQINLGVVERTMPSLWEGNDPVSGFLPRNTEGGFRDWKALHTAWERFGQFSAYRGDNICVFPVQSYDMNFLQGEPELMLPKGRDIYSKGYRARVVDPMERDIFKLMLLTAQKYGVRLVADFMNQRLWSLIPLLARQSGVPEDGMLLTGDASGKPWRGCSGARMPNPAHPVVRKYMVDLMEAMGRQYGKYPAFAGVRTRQWDWPSELDCWFFDDKLGCDDFTVGLFCKETGCKLGPVAGDEAAFKARRQKLFSDYREAWLSWRCQKVLSLREEMLNALRKYSPDARLFSDGVFNREGGLDPALLASRRDLGWGAGIGKFGGDQSVGTEWNYPDPVEFANFDQRTPESLRRTLKNLVPWGPIYPNGMNCNQAYRSHPYQLEGPALALAEGKLEYCNYGGQWCLPPADEGLRLFVQAWRAIPDLKYKRFLGEGGGQGPIACWYAHDKDELTVYLVNRTPRPREVILSFDVDPKGATDLVTGEGLPAARTVTVKLNPFMPGVVKVKGVKAPKDMNVPLSQEEIAKLGHAVDNLRAISPLTQGATETLYGAGEKYTSAAEDIGEWSHHDLNFTFADIFKPIDAAWRADRPHEAARLLDDFNRRHLWWYEAFGWPADFYVPVAPKGQVSTFSDLFHRRQWASSGTYNNAETVEGGVDIPGSKDKFLVASQGERMTFRFNPYPGIYELRIWGLFGGDYNPINVEFMGRPAGRINVPYTKEQQVHQVLSVQLKWPWSPQDITLVGEGKKGLAINRIELRAIPPAPLRKWQAIGLFDKKAGLDDWKNDMKSMDIVFPPEEKVDLSASYTGMDGKQVSWKAIDLGKDKILQLQKLFPYDVSQGNGVAYLATWIRSPSTNSNHSLSYSMDWYGKAWLNGELILPKIQGPWKNYVTQKIQLREGWNCLLVKTSTGSAGWNAIFAINDAGDLEYSGTPPQKEVK
ncbi:MAG: hypothetical protein WAX69_18470 [Victivallales bacterium]